MILVGLNMSVLCCSRMDVVKRKSKIFSWPIFHSNRNLAKDNFLFKNSMTVNIHLTPAPWNFLPIAKKTTFLLCAVLRGLLLSGHGLHHPYHIICMWSQVHTVLARHGARETQGPEPGFASIRSLAWVSNVGTHSAWGEPEGTGREKGGHSAVSPVFIPEHSFRNTSALL